MEEKYFKVIWKTQKVEYLHGISIQDAFMRVGYNPDEILNVDEWDGVTGGLPVSHKEIIIMDNYDGIKHKLLYGQGGEFADAIRKEIYTKAPDVDGDLIRIEAFNTVYQYFIMILPFQIVCRSIPEKKENENEKN